MKTFILHFLLLTGLTILFSSFKPSPTEVNGTLRDQQEAVVPFANISVLNARTKELITVVVTDENGEFSLVIDDETQIILSISSIGYQTFESEPCSANNIKEVISNISLVSDSESLDAVVVETSRPDIVFQADKTVVNVEGTVFADGNSTLDVVSKSPGIFIDDQDNISLNGRTGVVVMINGKRTYMSSTDLANYLRSIPADNIKNIEIITNPSAKFDAEGTAGVINIQLKQNNFDGVFGNINAGANYNGYLAPNFGASLNIKKGKFSNQFNVNVSEYEFLNELDIVRNFVIEKDTSVFNQNSEIEMQYQSSFLSSVTEYAINDQHSIGLNLQASTNNGSNLGDSRTRITNSGSNDIIGLRALNDNASNNIRAFGSLNYTGKLDSLGSSISSDIDYTYMISGSDALLENASSFNYSSPSYNYIQNINDMAYRIFTAKADYKKVFSPKATLETGVKGSFVYSDNEIEILDKAGTEGEFIENPNSNHFLYTENVLAAYASFTGVVSPKLSYQIGLRAENSDIIGNSLSLDSINTQNYLSFFPSAFVQRTVNKNYQIIVSANRRITRPNYRLLNPYVYYIDALTTDQGNPNLRPQFSNNFEINNIIKQRIQVSLSYAYNTDVFQQVFTQDEESKTTATFTDNFDESQNWNARAMFPIKLTKWWSSQNMAQVSYSQWKSQIGDEFLDRGQVSYMARSQSSFTLPKGFKAQLMAIYIGPSQYGQAVIGDFWWMDAGISKNFMQDKLSVSLNVTDLFRTNRIFADIQFADINSNFSQYRGQQGVRLNLRYNFSKGERFRVQSRSGSEEERRRLGQQN